MFTLGQLTQSTPLEGDSQVCVVSASVTHTYTQGCMRTCVCVSSGVREIIASEPGGECRQEITHGRGVGQS